MSELTISLPIAKPLSELDDRARLDVLMLIADKYLQLPQRIVEGGLELKVVKSRFDFARINFNHKPSSI